MASLDFPDVLQSPSSQIIGYHGRKPSLEEESQLGTAGTRRRLLSCRECSRRKIKCDKKVPCSACVGRGESRFCHRRAAAARQRPALDETASVGVNVLAELENLRGRLARIESTMNLDGVGEPPNHERNSEFEENGLAGAIEEAALGIGEVRRWKGALGLVDSTSSDENSLRWFTMPLSTCLSTLPPQHESQALVDMFCEHLNWMCGCLHVPTLTRMHHDFWTKPDRGQLHRGMYLAQLFALLSIAAYLLDDQQIEVIGLDVNRLRCSAPVWFDCCLATFFRCDGLIRPSLMGTQVLITLNYGFHLSGNTRIHRPLGHVNNGFARALNLHLLGSDRSGSVEEIVQREIGRRVWWQLVEAEWYFSTYHRYSCQPVKLCLSLYSFFGHSTDFSDAAIAPNHFNTAMPDLLDDGVYASATPENDHSLSFIVATSQSSRVLYELYGPLQPNQHPSYDAVLNASNRLENIRRCFPADIQGYSADVAPTPSTRIHMNRVIGMTLAYRLYLIHRSYFVKSLNEPAFRQSCATCISAAEVILGLSDRGIPATFYRLWNITLYLVAAGTVLALDLVTSSSKMSVPETVSRRGKLTTLVGLLNTVADQSGIATRGAKLISHLCDMQRNNGVGWNPRASLTRDQILDLAYSSESSPESWHISPSDPRMDASEAASSSAAIFSDQGAAAAELAAVQLDEDMLIPSTWAGLDGVVGANTFDTYGAEPNPDQFLGFISDLLPH